MQQRLVRTFASWHSVAWLVTAMVVVSGIEARGAAAPLRVATTVPDLESLAHDIGGDQAEVAVFGKGTEDPHFVEAQPSFIKVLSQEDLYTRRV